MTRLKTMRNKKLAPKTKLVNFKALPAELQAIQKKANEYTGGNLAAWVRFSAMNHVPKKSDLIEN